MASRIQSQGHGHLIGSLKADAVHLVAQTVGIVLGHVHGRRAELFVNAHRHGRAEVVAEEHHGRANTRFGLEILPDLLRLLAGNTGNVRQPLGVILHDLQRLLPKVRHDPLRQLGANPLDGAGGQVAQNRGGIRGQVSLVLLHLELAAVLGIVHPVSPQNEGIPLTNVGHHAAGGDHVILHTEIQNGIPVLLVGIDDMLHRTLQLGQPISGTSRTGYHPRIPRGIVTAGRKRIVKHRRGLLSLG